MLVNAVICVVVCCSVLLQVAVCCFKLQCVASYWLLTIWALDARECCHMCCSVLQCVAVCCSVLQCVAGSCNVLLATG